MVASYLLSSTLVPVLSIWLLRTKHESDHGDSAGRRRSAFERFRDRYGWLSARVVRLRWAVVAGYLVVAAAVIFFVGRGLGREIFPIVDAGQFTLRVRAPAGTRIEATEQVARKTLDAIAGEVGRTTWPSASGTWRAEPAYPINTIYLWTSGPEEAVLQVQLKPSAKVRIAALQERLRQRLPEALPGARFSFEPSDIVSRVMSFGSPTPIEVAVSGPNLANSRQYAEKVRAELAGVPTLRTSSSSRSWNTRPSRWTSTGPSRGRWGDGGPGGPFDDGGHQLQPVYRPQLLGRPKSGIGYQVQVQVPIQR